MGGWSIATGGLTAVRTLEDAINDLDLTDPLMAQVLFPITSQHEMAGVTFGDYPPMVIRLDTYSNGYGATKPTSSVSLRSLARHISIYGNWRRRSLPLSGN